MKRKADALTSAVTGCARSREKALVRKSEAIVSPPERPKGRPAVYWVRIEAPCRGCLKVAREVEQILLGRGCKFEITSNREMLARIRRGLRLAIMGADHE